MVCCVDFVGQNKRGKQKDSRACCFPVSGMKEKTFLSVPLLVFEPVFSLCSACFPRNDRKSESKLGFWGGGGRERVNFSDTD